MPEQKQAGVESKRAPYPYYVSFLSSVQGNRSHFRELLIWLSRKVETHGWKRVAACYTLTGQPRQLLELYRLPDGPSLLPTLEDLGRESNYLALLRLCRSRQMELTYGLPYDAGAGDSSGPLVKYPREHLLQIIHTLKADQFHRFIEVMRDVRELFYKEEWSLLSASQSLTPPYRLTHLWRFGDADELGELMRKLTAEPVYAVLNSCCESQWQQLLYALEMPGA